MPRCKSGQRTAAKLTTTCRPVRRHNLTKTMTQRETDNFDAYYDEIADEQYEMWKEQKEIPQLRTIDTTSLQRSLDRMAALLKEFDEVTR